MTRINKSIVLTALVPAARRDETAFLKAVDRLAGLGVQTIEYAAPLEDAPRRGQLLARRGLEGIFLAATFQKEQRQNLSSPVRETRAQALAACKSCLDAAIQSGAKGVLITSGAYPDQPGQEKEAWRALEESLHSLIGYAKGQIRLLLEPGDRAVDSRQLAGPTDQVLALMRRMGEPLSAFGLTIDVSHLAQLGEDAAEALEKSAPYCDHVHLANCVLTAGDPLYGDKHPRFAHPGAFYDSRRLRAVADELKRNSPHEALTLAVEVISREEAPYQMMDRVMGEEGWFFDLR